jgi:sulfite reductase subunit B
MTKKLRLVKEDKKLFVPQKAVITNIKTFTDKEKFFALELESGKSLKHDPGQFLQVSVLGIGEAPISISSPPSKDNKFELCVRAIGDVTNKLHTLKKGEAIYVRGPFGHGFDTKILAKLKGKHLLFIAGGIGYIPLRSLINKVLKEQDKYKKISILYGCRTPNDRMYQEELKQIHQIGGKVQILETVDHGDEKWKGNVGVITGLIPKVSFEPKNTVAIVVGPPVMYKFVLISLLQQNLPKQNIYMSLERRMKCGIGKCGHCQMEGIYVCQEGPVFNYSDIESNAEVF